MLRKISIVPLWAALAATLVAVSAQATVHEIRVGNFFFAPQNTTVDYGDTVRWRFVGGTHTSTSDPSSAKSWNSGSKTSGTFDIVIAPADGPGPFPYHCALHPMMQDTIRVSGPNERVNPSDPAPSDQNNASVALSETILREVYSVYNNFLAPGNPAPSVVSWSWSPLGGQPGSFMDAVKPPDPPFTEEWNASISAVATGGYVIVGSQRAGAPWGAVPNAIVMNLSPGGGAGFGAGVPVFANVPGVTWVDYPVVEVDDDPGSPNFGDAHIFWTEFTDADGGDTNGNGNPFDDGGDTWMTWTTSTAIGGGAAPPYPAFNPPVAVGPPGAFPVWAASMASQRAALDVAGLAGTPALPPGGVYTAYVSPVAGIVFVDASPAPGAGAPWGALTGGAGPVPAVAGILPVPPVLPPGILVANAVTIAVDNGPLCPGNVYIAWTDMTPSGGVDVDIMFAFSPNGGLAWSPPMRVNQDPLGNGRDQFAPHMRVDDLTGQIVITYYDRRNDPANLAVEVWSSTSTTCGTAWLDCMISDAGPVIPLSNTPFPTAFYVGDYLGSDQNRVNHQAFVWNDARNSADQDIFFEGQKRPDTDADGVPDFADNCVLVFNPAQTDADGDTYGVPCDCDDSDPGTNPGATEICDGLDNDCDTFVDEGPDGDGDGVSALCDCNDADNSIYPGAPEVPNDGIDQDCNGVDAINCFADGDSDNFGRDGSEIVELSGVCGVGRVPVGLDCDDTDPSIYPGAPEIPNDGIDQDCDGSDLTGCCVLRVGDANGVGGDEPTIGDVSIVIDALFITGSPAVLPCLAEADINQSGGASPVFADITIGDVSALIDYLFITGPSLGLPACL